MFSSTKFAVEPQKTAFNPSGTGTLQPKTRQEPPHKLPFPQRQNPQHAGLTRDQHRILIFQQLPTKRQSHRPD